MAQSHAAMFPSCFLRIISRAGSVHPFQGALHSCFWCHHKAEAQIILFYSIFYFEIYEHCTPYLIIPNHFCHSGDQLIIINVTHVVSSWL